jgi:Ca-activated chloride channel family protein
MQATLGQGCGAGQLIPGEGENYIATSDSAVKQAAVEQASTFSIDVDTGAYSNVRRFPDERPAAAQTRCGAEELINYFSTTTRSPKPAASRSASPPRSSARPGTTRPICCMSASRATSRPRASGRPPTGAFLVDVSGSMDQPDKLPLLRLPA